MFTVAQTDEATSFARCEPNECTAGLTIPSSNRDDAHPCSGHTGDTCDFVCHDGSQMAGIHTCGTDGTFSGGSCAVVDCWSTINGLDPHATASCTGDTGFGGESCVATCDEGYRGNPDALAAAFTCGTDAQWAGDLVCVPESCVGGLSIDHAVEECSPGLVGRFVSSVVLKGTVREDSMSVFRTCRFLEAHACQTSALQLSLSTTPTETQPTPVPVAPDRSVTTIATTDTRVRATMYVDQMELSTAVAVHL